MGRFNFWLNGVMYFMTKLLVHQNSELQYDFYVSKFEVSKLWNHYTLLSHNVIIEFSERGTWEKKRRRYNSSSTRLRRGQPLEGEGGGHQDLMVFNYCFQRNATTIQIVREVTVTQSVLRATVCARLDSIRIPLVPAFKVRREKS